jgi:polysaccharide biosynthesis protein PslG
MGRRTLLAALLATLVTLIVAAPAAAVPRNFYGIVPQAGSTDADFARMGQGRVGTYRWPLHWGQVEQTKGTYSWTATDTLITQLSNNGIEPRPFVCCVPSWLHSDTKVPPTGPAEDAAWKAFLRAAVQRYGPNGTFWADHPAVPLNPITAWQILNEENSSSFNHPKPDPTLYAHILEISNNAIHEVDPNAYIVLGGMFGTPHPKEPPAIGIPAWKFLQKLYKRGAKNNFDAIAPHPYGRSVADVKKQINKHRKVLKKNHDKGKDIMVTEMGWSSDKNIDSFLGMGRKGQAKILKQSFRLLKKNRKKWNIRSVMWFTFRDHNDPAFCVWCDTAGLFDLGFNPKPAWKQYVKFTGGTP